MKSRDQVRHRRPVVATLELPQSDVVDDLKRWRHRTHSPLVGAIRQPGVEGVNQVRGLRSNVGAIRELAAGGNNQARDYSAAWSLDSSERAPPVGVIRRAG